MIEFDNAPLAEQESAQSIRLRMAEAGWRSHDRLTDQGWGTDGKMGYSVWFERNEWHGNKALAMIGTFATYHAHTSDLGAIDKCVATAAARAERAYRDFPDCPPSQGTGGTLVARTPFGPHET